MLKILPSIEENARVRAWMKSQGLSFVKEPGFWDRFKPKNDRLAVGDLYKSWDVNQAATTLKANLQKTDAVLDMGAYCSEILLVLNAMGFTNLHGIDLNPDVKKMPFADKINFSEGDFYNAAFPDETFGGITSISAIEHGCDVPRLLAEVARLLKPGGIFIASTDYWPQKIDTTGVTMFNLNWTIFSEAQVQAIFDTAAELGLKPLGELEFKATQAPIECVGRNYTFALLALRKKH